MLKYFKLKLLQKRDFDILDAYNMMEDVIKVLIKELSLCHKL